MDRLDPSRKPSSSAPPWPPGIAAGGVRVVEPTPFFDEKEEDTAGGGGGSGSGGEVEVEVELELEVKVRRSATLITHARVNLAHPQRVWPCPSC